MNSTPRFVNQIKTYNIAVDSAATNVEVFTAGTDGSKIEWLAIATDDTATAVLTLTIEDDAASTFPLGTVGLAVGAGTVSGTPTVNGLDATSLPFLYDDAHGNKHLNLEASHKLLVSVDTLTGGKQVTVSAGVRNYAE